jgi:Carboxypeptidase regulatory-like domain
MKRVLVMLMFVCFPLLYAGAQTTAEISGTVLDPSGAAVAGAQVQVTDVDTNAIRTTQTSDDGGYLLPSLPIGPYKLQVTKEGFVTYQQSGIVLQVNSNPAINVTLQVGAVTQTVEVQANAAMVETESNAGLGQVIQPEQVNDLPLNGRQATQLILLSGGAVNNTGVGGVANNLDYQGPGGTGVVAYSVAGSQSNETNYFMDGAIHMDFRTNVGLPFPFPDALQEFKVESSALSASSGNHSGGAVNVATKSGTNSFHGDAFDYFRNTVMDAYPARFVQSNGLISPTTPIPDNLKRNQFGGIIGGPIKKDKLFFFYGFQGTEERVIGTLTTAHVPTVATLAGDFTAMLAPPCQKTQVFLNSAFTTAPNSNMIKPALLATPSAVIAAKFSAFLPPATDACGTVTYYPFTNDHEYQNVARVDWQHTQNDTLFFRYFITDYTLLPYYANHDILTAGAPGLSDRFQSVDIGDTHIFSPRVISSLRLSFTRTATVRTGPAGIPTWTSLGSNVTTAVPSYTGQNAVTNYFSPTEPAFPGYDFENMFGISENIGWTAGAHQLSFGFSGMHVQMNNDGLFQVNANFTFGGTITGNALADFLTGNPSRLSQGGGQLGRDGQNFPALYFQDNWKVKRNFQVNYGLRWDPFIPQHNKYRQTADFSLAGYNGNQKSQQFVNAPPGVTFPGDLGFNGNSPTATHLWDFSPRLGIVWDPRGKGLETVRAGYGIFYDTSVLWNTMHIVLNPPWGETIAIVPPTVAAGGGLANPWAAQPGGNPFPIPLNPPATVGFPQGGTWIFEDQNVHPTNSQQWNLALQKQFGGNWLVSATYLGSKTTHAWLGQNLDPSTIISAGMTAPGIVSTTGMVGTTGPCTLNYGGTNVVFNPCNGPSTLTVAGVGNENARRALTLSNPTIGPLLAGGLVEDFSNGNSAYNGLLVSAQHRLSKNFSILANLTWSHCMDQGEIGQDIGNAFQNPANRKADWGPCASDRRKIFNLSMVVQSPRYESRVVQMLAGNWQASGIFTASSGGWLNVTDGVDQSLTGVGADRPDEIANPFVAGAVAGNPGCTAPTSVNNVAHWFNPCAFVAAPLGTFGTFGRTGLQGPGNWNFDAAIWRTFPIREGLKLDFRAEAFNAFNHLEIGNPGTGIYSNLAVTPTSSTLTPSTSTGLITSAANGPRILQLALKLTF